MVDTELKSILSKSGSENLHGQIIVAQSKKGNRKINVQGIHEKLKMDFFFFF